MKTRPWIVILIALFLVLIVWMGFMSVLNSRSTPVTVEVAAQVDEVKIFREGDASGQPVADLLTHGQALRQVVYVENSAGFSFLMQSPPAGYYFVTKQGNQMFTGTRICCRTGLRTPARRLVISGLSAFEVFDEQQ